MERRFQGESLNKVDGKGRVSIPVKFRRVLQNSDAKMAPGGMPRLYIAYGNPNVDYVECLSGNAYDEIDAMIQSEQRGSQVRILLEHLYYAKCEENTVDDNGRLVVPPAARDKIGLADEALFQGKGDKFHILKPQDGAAAEGDIQAMLAALGQGNDFFDPLSLVGARGPSGPNEA
ncbi:MAG: cell division/cell wall cluster transcriptional repressor MraZ [Pseudomonadota bacterium]